MEETSWGDSEHRWVKPGQLFTKGPGTYKIPSFNDVPSDMRVKLMDRANAFAVHSSKAREPGFCELAATTRKRCNGRQSSAAMPLFPPRRRFDSMPRRPRAPSFVSQQDVPSNGSRSSPLLLAFVLQAVGEPPFFMASSAFFAIRDAVASARKDHGEAAFFRLNSPASSER